MKRIRLQTKVQLTLLTLFFAITYHGICLEFEDVGTLKIPADSKWGGLLWKSAELTNFRGRPTTTTDQDLTNFVTIAYDRYVSYYDLKGHAPRWVAYVTDRASAVVTDKKSRTGKEFERPRFYTDGVLAEASKAIRVPPTEDEDFKDRVPEGLEASDEIPKSLTARKAATYPAYIERGHLAANNTMKTWGSTEQGKKAQYESFSLANVVPQMSAHNAPTWSALEAQCLNWAKELGTVCVVVGPIYKDPNHPRHILERKTGEMVDIRFPDALFCVVIGKRNGKTSAVGFIMPHITANYSFKDKAVPVDDIEQATGIDFMPQMGEPNVLETTVDRGCDFIILRLPRQM